MSAAQKVDAIDDALELVKERCLSLTTKLGVDPATLAKIVGGVLGAVVIVVWLSIILYKHRKARSVPSMPKSRTRRA